MALPRLCTAWLELTQPFAPPPPPCVPPGGRHVLEESWKLLPGPVRLFVKEAEASTGQAGCIDLGGRRSFTVAEALVLDARFGPRFAATVAEAVCLELLPKKRFDGQITNIAKQAKAIRFGDSTSISISNFLKSPVFGPRPRLVRKGTAAAVAETAAAALVEHESARRVNLEMAAAAYDEALELDPLAEVVWWCGGGGG